MKALIYMLAGVMCAGGFAAQFPDEEEFANPPSEYRLMQIPHSWALRKDLAELDAQIRESGLGGLVVDAGTDAPNEQFERELHVNYGYLQSEPLWNRLNQFIEYAKDKGLKVWIYDEYAYPSGSAGGQVVLSNPEFDSKIMGSRTLSAQNGKIEFAPLKDKTPYFGTLVPFKDGAADLKQAKRITLDKARSITVPDDSWKLIVLESWFSDTWNLPENAWRRNGNIMDKAAMAEFIRLTHERYKEKLKGNFKNIEAFFTDEPQLSAVEKWIGGRKNMQPAVQWTDEIVERFKRDKGYDIETALPALFADFGPATPKMRIDFYDVYTDLIAENFFGQIQKWCRDNGTMSSGHMLLEESLLFHIMFSGSFFKNFNFMDLPGIDYLCSFEYRSMHPGWADGVFKLEEDYTAKLASSVANIYGKKGVFSESLGLAEGIDPQRAKGVLAWHLAEGVTYISTYTVQDYFPREGYKSVSDFVGRIAYFARKGKSVSKIAVLAPETAIWGVYNPPTGGDYPTFFGENQQATMIDDCFRKTVVNLLKSQTNFEIISPSMLGSAKFGKDGMKLGQMEFSHIIVPAAKYLSTAEIRALKKFAEKGGRLCFVWTLPEGDDAVGANPALTKEFEQLVANNKNVSLVENEECDVSKEFELPKQAFEFGGSDKIRTQIRKAGKTTFAIVANPQSSPVEFEVKINPKAKSYKIYDPETGLIADHPYDGPFKIQLPRDTATIITIE